MASRKTSKLFQSVLPNSGPDLDGMLLADATAPETGRGLFGDDRR